MNEDNKDALNNLINSIQEKMNNNESSQQEENNTNSFDMSSILNAFNANKEDANTTNNNDNTETGFDPSILLKMQKIMSTMNSNNPKKELLLSLKPFLRKSRQDKMNDYLTILNVITVLESFKNKDSD